jgi:hypothetical protein
MHAYSFISNSISLNHLRSSQNHSSDYPNTLFPLWSNSTVAFSPLCPLLFGGRGREDHPFICKILVKPCSKPPPPHPMTMRVSGSYTTTLPHLQDALASLELSLSLMPSVAIGMPYGIRQHLCPCNLTTSPSSLPPINPSRDLYLALFCSTALGRALGAN